jgi:Flp pilus assembly protein TadD
MSENMKEKKPSHTELKILLEHYQNGRYEDAEKLAKSITQQFPNHPFSWKILGPVLKKTGRIREALAVNQKAVEIDSLDAQTHNNLGNLLIEIGRLDEAEMSYKKAIELKPDFVEAHNNLGNALKELYRFEEAISSFKKALELKPNFDNAHHNLGTILLEQHKFLEAAQHFKLCDTKKSKNYLLRSLYLLGDKPLFYEHLDDLLNQGEINAVIGSLISHSEIKYGLKRSNPFCNDPLKYILKTDLTEGCNFQNIFVKAAKNILNDDKVLYRNQGYLTNGYQTAGNLFDLEGILIDEIKKIIHSELEKYRIYFKGSSEGLIRSWPTDYYLYGWLISMKSGSKLNPHMHDTGWISGSIYINVPPKSKTDSGNLVLCIDDKENEEGKNKNQKKIIDVVTGSLCLFPSSLLHYTIPFEAEEERIVLAFDVVPK